MGVAVGVIVADEVAVGVSVSGGIPFVVAEGVGDTLGEGVKVELKVDVTVSVPSGVIVPGVMVDVGVGLGAVAVMQTIATLVAVGANLSSSKWVKNCS